MVEKVRMMTAFYPDVRLQPEDSGKLRGFFADLDQWDGNLHNHTKEGKEIYRYPSVQYKVIQESPVVVAWGEGICSVSGHLMRQDKLIIGNQIFLDTEIQIQLSTALAGCCTEGREYRFLTPWLALNQDNYLQFHQILGEEKERLLSRILIGNILSMCKGLGVTVERELWVSHNLKAVLVSYKGKRMKGFLGSFRVNCHIPDLFGLGKGTARGYGTVCEEAR